MASHASSVLGGALGPALLSSSVALAGCGHTPIRVDGVIHESPEMRPLQQVPADSYRQVRVLVRLGGPDSQGTSECGYAQLEGTMESEDVKNVACVPSDAPNDAVRLVRQRMRAYGLQVVRDGSDAYDYAVDLRVVGAPPKRPDRMAAKATAKLTFVLRQDDGKNGFFAGVDMSAANAAFPQVARDCALHDAADSTTFSVMSSTPMNPEFDMAALTADAVDDAVGCAQLARFFREAHTRFAAAPGPSAPPAAPAPPSPVPAAP